MEYPSGKKKDGNFVSCALHHALRAMMQFPVIIFRVDTSIHKQKNKFIP
jgi:hypothetical protein